MDFELQQIKRKKFIEMVEKQLVRGEPSSLKICIPTVGWKGFNDYVSEHFGRAPTFTIVNLATKSVEVIPNTSKHMGGRELPPEIMKNHGVKVMICSGLGPRAIKMFEQFGIEVYVGAYGTVRDAIQAWQTGILQQATNENVCKMHRHT